MARLNQVWSNYHIKFAQFMYASKLMIVIGQKPRKLRLNFKCALNIYFESKNSTYKWVLESYLLNLLNIFGMALTVGRATWRVAWPKSVSRWAR